jgi:hypothetical protein
MVFRFCVRRTSKRLFLKVVQETMKPDPFDAMWTLHPSCIQVLRWSLQHSVKWTWTGSDFPTNDFPTNESASSLMVTGLSIVCEVALKGLNFPTSPTSQSIWNTRRPIYVKFKQICISVVRCDIGVLFPRVWILISHYLTCKFTISLQFTKYHYKFSKARFFPNPYSQHKVDLFSITGKRELEYD